MTMTTDERSLYLPPTSRPAGVPVQWLWLAIGVLGTVAVALAGTLLWQHTNGGEAGSASARAPMAVSAAPRTPEAEIIEEKSALPQASKQNIATNRVANEPARPAPAPVVGAVPPRPGAVALQPARAAAVCAVCGQVESVQAVQQAAPPSGVGAVAGGVLGAVVGNQIGKGSGRTAATVLGAVGGGYAGHQIEQRTRTQTVYQVAVRMEDGSLRHFQRSQAPAIGTPVVLEGNGFRVGAPAQPGTVQVVNRP